MTPAADAASAPRLVTRREAEPILGYAPHSLKAVMQQQRGRWPDPLACRVKGRALLWDLDALRTAARHGGTGSSRPSGADTDGLVTCLSCGPPLPLPGAASRTRPPGDSRRVPRRAPTAGLRRAHGHRRPRRPGRLHGLRDVHRSRLHRPDARRSAALAGTHPPLRRVPGGHQRPARRTSGTGRWRPPHPPRSPTGPPQHPGNQSPAAGFASMAAAIHATRHLSSRAAAARIGIGASTVKRWRLRLDES